MDIVVNKRPPHRARPEQHPQFRTDKPPLGGWLPGLVFSPLHVHILNAAADQLIPAGEGFPAPSEVDVVSFFGKYIAPEGIEPKWYPFIGETDFKARLDSLGETFVQSSHAEQVKTLTTLEKSDAPFFSRLLEMTYYAYYSRPAVIIAINTNLNAGKNLRNSPQPYGYSDSMDDWDDELFDQIQGSYKRTEDVRSLVLPVSLREASTTPDRGSQGQHEHE
jgi:hypothetical protein